MVMIRIIAGSFLILSGGGGIFLGTMFLIASSGIASRLTAGSIILALGALLFAAGIYFFRKGIKERPGSVHESILRAAAKHNGTITGELLDAETGGGDAVNFELAAMIRSGKAKVENIDGGKTYIFPGLQFRLKFKKCPYCGSDYPVKEDIERCPSCGGDLKIVTEGSSGGEDKFSMDI